MNDAQGGGKKKKKKKKKNKKKRKKNNTKREPQLMMPKQMSVTSCFWPLSPSSLSPKAALTALRMVF
jgi:hypothetical protein